MLAPMAAERFGPEHAAQIYTRLWLMVPLANFVGSNLMMGWRSHARGGAAAELAATCDDAAFAAAFGAPKEQLPALLKANTVTLDKLLAIAQRHVKRTCLGSGQAVPSLAVARVHSRLRSNTQAPAGTVDPSPALYDPVFYALPCVGLLALGCNVAAFRLPLKR